jgi:hypothetical protein
MNSLILGLAAGYHYGDVRPFLQSLEECGYEGECVLFVSETTRDLERMADHAVLLVPFERTAGQEDVPYNALRYFLYLDFMRSLRCYYSHVMMTDVRDVVFQRDPFSFSWPEGINCTLEDRRMTLATCPHNSHWIRTHQGQEAMAAVGHEPISCSGTTVCDQAGAVRYLEAMTERLIPFKGGERIAGYDQGVHNVLLHTGQLGKLTLHDNGGPILTLGYTKGEPVLDAEGFVLNDNGERAHIVHQYDRKSDLFKKLRKRFA